MGLGFDGFWCTICHSEASFSLTGDCALFFEFGFVGITSKAPFAPMKGSFHETW